jgi:hypothetical protein
MPKGKVPTEERHPPAMLAAIHEAAAPLLRHFLGRLPGDRLNEEQEEAIVELLAVCGDSLSHVARLTGVSVTEVWRVKHRNMEAFSEARERWKREHAFKAADLADRMAEKMAEKIEHDEFSLRDGAVTWGILVQRGMDLAGEGATITHNHKHSVDQASLDAAMERIQQLRQAEPLTIEADFTVID